MRNSCWSRPTEPAPTVIAVDVDTEPTRQSLAHRCRPMIGVAVGAGRGGRDSGQDRGDRWQRVLVGSQLDGVRDPVLGLRLCSTLAGAVGGQPVHCGSDPTGRARVVCGHRLTVRRSVRGRFSEWRARSTVRRPGHGSARRCAPSPLRSRGSCRRRRRSRRPARRQLRPGRRRDCSASAASTVSIVARYSSTRARSMRRCADRPNGSSHVPRSRFNRARSANIGRAPLPSRILRLPRKRRRAGGERWNVTAAPSPNCASMSVQNCGSRCSRATSYSSLTAITL